jgi:GT2 family glycosyltransferase
MSGFETGVSATGGWVGTPPGVNKLQEMIGRDLQNKYDHLSRYTRKLPTMSLCVPTSIVKQLKFDESLPVGQDTDFCYRLPGKIRYVAEAKLWHHHRATWWSYFNQQYKNAKYAVVLFNKNRHMATKGDGITNKIMMVQPFLMLLSIIPVVWYFSLPVLMMIWAWEARKITKVRNELLYAWLLMYPTRAMAYLLGLIMGIVKVVTKR